MSPSKKILSKDGQPMLSARAVAARLKCAPDYVSKLCRDGKLDGQLLDGQWFVTPASIAAFEEVRVRAKQERADQLAQQRRSENFEYKKQHASVVGRAIMQARSISIGAPIGAVMGSALLFGALVFASAMHAPTTSSLAAVSQAESAFFGNTPPALPTSSGKAFVGASQFLSDVFATLFGGGATEGRVAEIPPQDNFSQKSSDLLPSVGQTSAQNNPASVSVPPTVIHTYPVVERTVVREVASAGVTEDYVTTRIQDLYNRLAVQISNLQNPGRESPLQNFAVSQVINNLNNTRLNGLTRADDINATYVQTGRFYVTGQADFGGTLNAATTTTGALTVNGNATTTGVAYFGTDVNIGGNTVIAGNLTVQNNNGSPGTAFAGTTTVTNLQVQNLSTSTFAGAVQVSGNTLLSNATSTNFFTTVASSTNLFTQNLQAAIVSLVNATSTNFFASTASSTSLFAQVGSIGGLVVQNATTTGTAYVGSTLGVGTTSPSGAFGVQGNALVSGTFTAGSIVATSSLTLGGGATIAGGFQAFASSTIGNGNQNGGLTIFGGATTTGNALFSGGVGIGIATSVAGTLQTSGNAYIGGNLTVVGNSVTLGASSANTLSVVSSITSSLIPNQNITYDLGSPSFYWGNAYIGTLNANNISAANTQISGTQSADFTINSDNVSSDAENANLIFFRGNVVPNAVLGWDSSNKRFTLNQSTFIQNASTNNLSGITLDLKGQGGQTGALFNVASSSGTNYFTIASAGLATLSQGLVSQASSTIGSGAQAGGLTISGGATTTGNAYFAGNVGIGTVLPTEALHIKATSGTVRNLLENTSSTGFAEYQGKSDAVDFRIGASGSGTAPFGVSSGGAGYIGTISNNPVIFAANSVAQMLLTTSGLGIGTVTGTHKLEVVDTTSDVAVFKNSTASQWTNVLINTDTASANLTLNSNSATRVGSFAGVTLAGSSFFQTHGGAQVFYTDTDNRPFNWVQSVSGVAATKMILNGNGNLGIATTSPTYKLSVEGSSSLGNQAIAGYFTATSSTVSSFAGGVTSYASTTIGAGTQTTGLTIFGGATTTGNAYIAGNVGIGTAVPTDKLQVSGGDIGITGSGANLYFRGPQAANVGHAGFFDLNLITNGLTRFTVKDAGLVGVGSTTPWGLLSVNANGITAGAPQFVVGSSTATNFIVSNAGNVGIGTTSPTNIFVVQSSGNGDRLRVVNTDNHATANITLEQTTASTYNWLLTTNYDTNGDFALRKSNSSNGDPYSAGTTMFVIKNSGNLGIGATAPQSKLSVVGSSGPSNNSGIAEFSTGTGAATDEKLVFGTVDGSYSWIQPLKPGTAYRNLVLNPSGGNVGIGVTNPLSTLQVLGNARFGSNGNYTDIIIATSTPLSGYNGTVVIKSNSTPGSGTAAQALYLQNNISGGTTRMDLLVDGNVGIGSTTPSNPLAVNQSGNVTVGNNTTYGLAVQNQGTTNFTIGSDATYAYLQSWASKPLQINNQGNNTLFNVGGGSVGIATTTPGSSYKLSVNGQSQFTNVMTLARADTTAAIGYIGAYTNIVGGGATNTDPTIYTATGNLLLAGGNVGIGTSSPQAALHVYGAGQTTAALTDSGAQTGTINITGSAGPGAAGSGGALIFSGVNDSGNNKPQAAIKSLMTNGGGQGVGDLAFSTRGATSDTNLTERMRILAGGNVGIGTTSPSTKFAVQGDELISGTSTLSTLFATTSIGIGAMNSGAMALEISQATGLLAQFTRPGTGVMQLTYTGGFGANASTYTTDNGTLAFSPTTAVSRQGYIFRTRDSGNTQISALYINNGGYIGIGTTTPLALLNVNGNSSSYTPTIFNVSSTTAAGVTSSFLNVLATGNTGVGSTTPWARMSVDTSNLSSNVPSFSVGSSTRQDLLVTQGGIVSVGSASPNTAAKFYVNGTGTNGIAIDTTAGGNALNFLTSGTYRWTMFADTGALYFYDQPNSTTRFTLQSATGNVGIGTSSPYSMLSVAGQVVAQNFVATSTTATSTFFGPTLIGGGTASLAPLFSVGTSSTPIFTIDSLRGTIGINQAAPASTGAKLSLTTDLPQGINVSSNQNTDVTAFRGDNTNTAGSSAAVKIQLNNNNANAYMILNGSGMATSSYNNPNGMLFRTDGQNMNFAATRADAYMSWYTGGSTERMRLTAGGALGIGMTPTYALDVSGDIRAATSVLTPYMNMGSSGTGKTNISLTSGGSQYGTIQTETNGGAGAWSLGYQGTANATIGTAALTWTGSGLVGIGSTTPWAQLSINPNNIGTGPEFAIGSSTKTDFIVTNAGLVGIGTTSPQANLGIQGSLGVNSTHLYLSAAGTVSVGSATTNAKFTINGSGANASHGELEISNTAVTSNVGILGIETGNNSLANGGVLGDLSIISSGSLILQAGNGGTVKMNNTATAQAQFFGWSQLDSDSRSGAIFVGSSSSFRGVIQYGANPSSALSIDNTYDSATGVGIQFRTRTSGSSTTTAMTILNGGNIGIGTTSPLARLDVAGANNGTSPLFQVSSVASFATTTRFIIDSSGLVGIGTSSPFAKLSVKGVGTGTGVTFQTTNSSDQPIFSITDNGVISNTYRGTAGAATSSITGAINLGLNNSTASYLNAVPNYVASINAQTTSSDTLVLSNAGVASPGAGINFQAGAVGVDSRLWTAGHIVSGYASVGSPSAYNNNFITLGTASAAATFRDELTIRAGNVGIGTSSPVYPFSIDAGANNPMQIYSTSQDTVIRFQNAGTGGRTYHVGSTGSSSGAGNGFSIYDVTGSATRFLINPTGNIGIGTTSPLTKLEISTTDTANEGAEIHLDSSSNSYKDWGIDIFQDQLRFFSTTHGSLANFQSPLILNSTTGNVGAGTSSPFRKMSIQDTVSTAQMTVAYDNNRYTDFLTNSVGDLVVTPQGQDIFSNDSNLWICSGGSCPSGTPTGTGNIIAETNIGIGTSTPQYRLTIESQNATDNLFQIASSTNQSIVVVNANGRVGIGTSTPTQQFSVADRLFVGAGGASGMGTATSTFQGDIKITGKLDVGTIDPVYTIDGVKYATYGHSTVGLKEEAVTVLEITDKNPKTGKYEKKISFKDLDKGSDLWLFYQVTDFGADWKNLVINLTASFDGAVFYTKVPNEAAVIVSASEPGEVSARFIANRFDSDKWPNIRPDQDGPYKGHELQTTPTGQATAAGSIEPIRAGAFDSAE